MGDIELFTPEYGFTAVLLRGVHRENGLGVIIKVGTSECENRWASNLHRIAPDLVARIYSTGSKLGEFEIHWLAMEAIPYGPLGSAWKGREFELFLDAGIRFYRLASKIDDPMLDEMVPADVIPWLQRALALDAPGPVDKLNSKIDVHWTYLIGTCRAEVAFDDFHLGNCMMRNPPPEGETVVLIDIHPRRQPWILDVAYLQVIESGDRNRLGHRNLIQRMAVKREVAGLSSLKGDELVRCGKIALGWLAASQWLPERAEREPDYYNAYKQFIKEAADV